MPRVILFRLLQLPLILAAIFAVTFVLVWMLPGNPLENEDGRRPPAEIQEALKKQYNLDDPWKFAGQYLLDVTTKFDFGPSMVHKNMRVQDILAQGMPVSLTLGVFAMAFAIALGVGSGLVGAARPGGIWDHASLSVALLGISLPTFVVGAVLLMVFSGWLNWLPAAGWSGFTSIVLPAITLGLAPAAYIARLTRLGLADVMRMDYIRTAVAKGVPGHLVLIKHALKVAFLPVLSFLGPAAAATLTGSFVVEKVFSIPGIGTHFVDAVLAKDQFLILAVVLVYSTLLVVLNLVVDMLYAWFDPRIDITA
jgi:oligopeptide transport system permease protein